MHDEYEFPSPIKEANSDINNKLAQLEKYLNNEKKEREAISDLHTVKEDEYDDEVDDEMNPAAFVHNKKEYEDHLMQVVEYDTVLKMIQ